MPWTFLDDRPIWLQLTEQITLRIVSGMYASGQTLPSVRTLASEAGVNPNTMQRAMAELEQQGLIETHRTAGRTVTANLQTIEQMRNQLAFSRIEEFMTSMTALGYHTEQIHALMMQWEKEEHK